MQALLLCNTFHMSNQKNKAAYFGGPVVATEQAIYLVPKKDKMKGISMGLLGGLMSLAFQDKEDLKEGVIKFESLPPELKIQKVWGRIKGGQDVVVVPKSEVRSFKNSALSGAKIVTGNYTFSISISFLKHKTTQDFLQRYGWITP